MKSTPYALTSLAALLSASALGYDCSALPTWQDTTAYSSGTEVQQQQQAYRANWWTQGQSPAQHSGPWQEWTPLGQCDGTEPVDPVDPVDPIDPVDPVDPVDPIDPVDPVDPVEPHPGDTPCRPDGLFQTPGLDVPYCTVYDELGIEIISPDHPRRIIGYFTSWRHGKNDQPAYLASDIPWQKITHINYAFAHVDSNHRISVGDVTDPNNSSTGMSWPDVAGAELDPNLPYQGHFNLLNRYKAEHPHVKTLIAVGGWAETGGYFDANGDRIASGGFYSMTTNPDGSINHAGIHTFAESAVAFLRQYQFDGLDIDYEYPTSMTDAGNPDDFHIANPLRGSLNASFVELMRVLRQYLDAASVEDGIHYQLTMAVPSSAYLLRGMEVFDALQYLDFINVMSYDLHGSWNQFVGPNAALFDTGEDAELVAWNYYNAAQYQQLGYLNTDWAFHYYRGALPAGRINIGIPYYSRGWQRVQGGHHGLWGTASLPDQSQCPPGTGGSTVSRCGDGAVGIDNLWHDLDTNGHEIPAGSNPLWHLRNLQQGIVGSYLSDYGLDPIDNPAHQLIGSYQHHYEPVAVAPWLWNDEKKVFLSIEDELSIATKAQYVIDQQIGGVMFWELAGDFSWHSERGEYFFGDTLTSIFFDQFKAAGPYGHLRSELPLPEQAVDLRFRIDNFKLGDQNFPINPSLTLTNHSQLTIPGGSAISFSVPTAIPDSLSDQSGYGLSVIDSGRNASGNNIGGLQQPFHRAEFSIPGYLDLAPGESLELTLNYQLPMPTPTGWRIELAGESFALSQEYPQLPQLNELPGDPGNGDPGNGGPGEGCGGVSPVYPWPQWPQTDWAGNPSHALGGDHLSYQGSVYRANWWTNSVPGSDGSWSLICNL